MSTSKTILFVAVVALLPIKTFAQQPVDTTFGASDLLNIVLPPIEVLFEGALNSAKQQQFALKAEAERNEMKTEKRKWLSYLFAYGIYQYGIAGVNSFMDLGSDYPIVYQNTGAKQVWYNAGINFRVPFDYIFNRGNKIRQQKLRIEIAEKDGEILYSDQKMEIIGHYYKVNEMLGDLRAAVELCALSKAQYDLSEKDYIVGAITGQSLSVAKGQYVTNVIQLERIKSELRTAILRLEVLSCTKLLK